MPGESTIQVTAVFVYIYMKTRVAIIFIFIFLLNNKTSIKGQENIICTGVILRHHLLPNIFVQRVVCSNWYIILIFCLVERGCFIFVLSPVYLKKLD